MRHDPHLLVEGCLIASFAMGAHACYIYVRGEFIREREHLQAAIDEAYEAKLIGKDNVNGWAVRPLRRPRRRRLYLRRGDGAAREPRGQEGPAAAEAAVPGQCRPLRLPDHGQQRRVHRGRARHPAPRRGLVRRHRPAEQRRHQAVLHLRPCRAALQRRRGHGHSVPRADRASTAAACAAAGTISRRSSPAARRCRMIPAEQIIDTPMDFDSLRKLQSGLGTAAVIVMDKSTDLIRAIARISYFYKHESCGQCTPCREGTGWMWRVLERMADGRAAQARDRHAARGDQAGRGPHHLRARRRGGLADPGPDRALPSRDRSAHRRSIRTRPISTISASAIP